MPSPGRFYAAIALQLQIASVEGAGVEEAGVEGAGVEGAGGFNPLKLGQ
jgi:hypothetical protein